LSSPKGAPEDLSSEFQLIPLEQLELGKKNVRLRDIAIDLDELAYSMKTFGLQQPIVVQPKEGKFEIIIGQRRYLAAKQLGWRRIPARVTKEKYSEFDARVISFSENVQRRDLSPRDKSDVCLYLLQELHTPQAIAEHLGLTEQTVRKWLGYAAVPDELKALVEQKLISVPQAIRVAQYIPDVAKAVAIAKRMAQEPKASRDRIMESVEELPDRSLEAIFRRAEEKKRQKKITFVLPEKWAFSMDRAIRRLNMTANEIARDATVEWLQMMRY
jgi:ParB family chromosome partitioning protein